jgi:hypothetical protein
MIPTRKSAAINGMLEMFKYTQNGSDSIWLGWRDIANNSESNSQGDELLYTHRREIYPGTQGLMISGNAQDYKPTEDISAQRLSGMSFTDPQKENPNKAEGVTDLSTPIPTSTASLSTSTAEKILTTPTATKKESFDLQLEGPGTPPKEKDDIEDPEPEPDPIIEEEEYYDDEEYYEEDYLYNDDTIYGTVDQDFIADPSEYEPTGGNTTTTTSTPDPTADAGKDAGNKDKNPPTKEEPLTEDEIADQNTWNEWIGATKEAAETIKQLKKDQVQGSAGKHIIYQRTTETDESTTGTFSIPGTNISGYILEPAGPSTTKSGTDRRIPAGTYKIIKNVGSKVGFRLYNDQVPESRAILIHSGNLPVDTEGCLLPGRIIGKNNVGDSKSLVKQIINHFNKVGLNGATITITDIQ